MEHLVKRTQKAIHRTEVGIAKEKAKKVNVQNELKSVKQMILQMAKSPGAKVELEKFLNNPGNLESINDTMLLKRLEECQNDIASLNGMPNTAQIKSVLSDVCEIGSKLDQISDKFLDEKVSKTDKIVTQEQIESFKAETLKSDRVFQELLANSTRSMDEIFDEQIRSQQSEKEWSAEFDSKLKAMAERSLPSNSPLLKPLPSLKSRDDMVPLYSSFFRKFAGNGSISAFDFVSATKNSSQPLCGLWMDVWNLLEMILSDGHMEISEDEFVDALVELRHPLCSKILLVADFLD
eukprot:TRINITY_DN308248_c0_g1_i1.p1 TRINITY_DN308248_c0_g1~~TRINITY_DN308248_c0_g1_i1.p1  ORF type:complete len:293 (-),score=77.62 TRINITY_DN308248_c0_g1_i1:921-1799(-)